MIRSSQYLQQRRRIVRYTAAEWLDKETRIEALAKARREAIALKGEIVIKVKYPKRALVQVISIKYMVAGSGGITRVRHHPTKTLLDLPVLPDEDT